MASGVRIHHPQLSGCTVLIPHPGDSRTGRKPKDYHIHLDGQGNAIVSETVWQRLQEARDSGLTPHQFIVLNEVQSPPPLVIGGKPEYRPTLRQEGEALKQIAPKGVAARIVRMN